MQCTLNCQVFKPWKVTFSFFLLSYSVLFTSLFSEHRYRKSLDDLQKSSDKKVALLTNATKKAETVVCILMKIMS